MKRIITIVVLFCFLLFNAGFLYSLHYCSSKLSSFALYDVPEKKCVCKSTEQQKDCCEDVAQVVVTDEQFAAASFKVSFDKVLIAELSFFFVELYKFFLPSFSLDFAEQINAPPLKIPTYLFVRNLRI